MLVVAPEAAIDRRGRPRAELRLISAGVAALAVGPLLMAMTIGNTQARSR